MIPAQPIERHLSRNAVFDKTGDYRYRLGRRWQSDGAEVAFVMLNPSRADEAIDDPTLRACIQFAQRWQYASLSVVNLFGYRTPHPAELKQATDPIGPENDAYVLQAVEQADKVVLAWGNHGVWMGRDHAILQQLSPYAHKLVCLQQNKGGQPRHPLYVKREQPITPFVFN
ncbi:MAG: DUF1643 domain-containing protein [Cyanobacteria bacterium J06581_3]